MYILRSQTKFRQTKHLSWIAEEIEGLNEPFEITTVVMNQYGDAEIAKGHSLQELKANMKIARKKLPKYN